MKKTFNAQERDAFAKAVSAVEGLAFTKADDVFFRSIAEMSEKPEVSVKRVVARAMAKHA